MYIPAKITTSVLKTHARVGGKFMNLLAIHYLRGNKYSGVTAYRLSTKKYYIG